MEIIVKYNKETCPKSDDWFLRGASCGWAHECVDCTANPERKK